MLYTSINTPNYVFSASFILIIEKFPYFCGKFNTTKKLQKLWLYNASNLFICSLQ